MLPREESHFPTTKKQKWLTRTARPEFTIALVRTPFLPPRYASFHVPLSFNKLDMRDYLQRVYGVGVVGVRSYIEQQKVTRMRPLGRWGYGRVRRPESKKRITVEMKEPFVWPEAPTDMAPYVVPFLSFKTKKKKKKKNTHLYVGDGMANDLIRKQMGKGSILQGCQVPKRRAAEKSPRCCYETEQAGTRILRGRGQRTSAGEEVLETNLAGAGA